MNEQQTEKDVLVRMLARHVLSHVTPEHCTADCMAGAILADGWTQGPPSIIAEHGYLPPNETENLREELRMLREHVLDENPNFHAMHELAKAYSETIAAYHKVTNGAPLSTTLAWLIEQGYLVPADPHNPSLPPRAGTDEQGAS